MFSNWNICWEKKKKGGCKKINNDNHKYLQLFDLIENKDNIGIKVDNPDEVIYNFIKENNLHHKKIIEYAMNTNNRKIINKINIFIIYIRSKTIFIIFISN